MMFGWSSRFGIATGKVFGFGSGVPQTPMMFGWSSRFGMATGRVFSFGSGVPQTPMMECLLAGFGGSVLDINILCKTFAMSSLTVAVFSITSVSVDCSASGFVALTEFELLEIWTVMMSLFRWLSQNFDREMMSVEDAFIKISSWQLRYRNAMCRWRMGRSTTRNYAFPIFSQNILSFFLPRLVPAHGV